VLNRRKFVGLTKVQATGNVKHRIDFGLDLDASKPLFATVFIKHALLALSLRFRALAGVLVFAKPSPDLSKSQNPPQHNPCSKTTIATRQCIASRNEKVSKKEEAMHWPQDGVS